MKFERDDVRVGLLVLVVLTLFGSLVFHRTLRAVFKHEALHRVHLENVADLTVGTEVQLLGLHVGQVNNIEMQRQGREYGFIATLGLRPDIVLWRGTKGVVNTRIVGGSYFDLRLPPIEERLTELRPGELMEGETSASLSVLVDELTSLARNTNRGFLELRDELRTRGLASVFERPELVQTFKEVSATLTAFRAASEAMDATMKHGDTSLVGLDASMAAFDKSMQALQVLLSQTSPQVDAVVAQVTVTLQRLQALSADVTALLKTAGPHADESLRALRRTLDATEELLELLKAKPNRVVFGTPTEQERAAAKKRVEEARQADQKPAPPR